MSAIIFVALAVGWALFLIPKALQRHDELARSRSMQDFSGRMRVLGREQRTSARPSASTTSPRVDSRAASTSGVSSTDAPTPAPVQASAQPRSYRSTRAAARRAARRRRWVLCVLTLALLGVGALAWYAMVPRIAVAGPAGLIVIFLLVARWTVRRDRVRSTEPVAAAPVAEVGPESTGEGAVRPRPDAGSEDTVGISLGQATVPATEPLADDGALWDPLPLNLPTYVDKPRAARTVRTIELTQTGVTSSGHDASDSALAREARKDEKAVGKSGGTSLEESAPDESDQQTPRAVGE